MTTFGVPPNFFNFAYISPIDLDTANLPGKTLLFSISFILIFLLCCNYMLQPFY